MEGLYVVVSAPSGTGKTSILREVLRMCPNLLFSVSHTTRPRRPGEKDGKDYYFITEEAFKDKLDRGEFAEWEENYGYLYGTSSKTMKEFLQKGFDLVLDIDWRGAKTLKKNYPGGVFVFILPPSTDELEKRLRGRGVESKQNIDKRLAKALDEIKEIIWYDYLIFNDHLETAVDTLRSIYVAEKSKRERLAYKIKEFLLL
ncbi:MAG: guanylate kinase [Deltaproteobacteria bacterium]|nr:MAG: guanylate kinase [Deltaproteobacteria bacterium]